jgi:hypothetical protein
MAKSKGINKFKVGFSIDKQTYADFEVYCNDRSINKSKLVDTILKAFLEKNKEKTLNEYV